MERSWGGEGDKRDSSEMGAEGCEKGGCTIDGWLQVALSCPVLRLCSSTGAESVGIVLRAHLGEALKPLFPIPNSEWACSPFTNPSNFCSFSAPPLSPNSKDRCQSAFQQRGAELGGCPRLRLCSFSRRLGFKLLERKL